MTMKAISRTASKRPMRSPARFLARIALAITLGLPVCHPCLHAQETEGWLSDPPLVAPVPLEQMELVSGTMANVTVASLPQLPPPYEAPPPPALGGSSAAPDEITFEIVGLTSGVVFEPENIAAWVKCFLFVAGQIEYEHYYGCKKGALLTYLERKGNDADLATLLVAMLRSAGYSARYGWGQVAFPTVQNADGWHIQDWLGVPVAGIPSFSAQRGFPATYGYNDGGVHRGLDRVWVEVYDGVSWIRLDPAFRRRLRVNPAIDVAAVTGYTRTGTGSLEAAAGGTVGGNWVQGISESGLGGYLAAKTGLLLDYIGQNHHDTDAASLLGGWRQEPFTSGGSQAAFGGLIQTSTTGYALPASLLTTISLDVRNTTGGTPVAHYDAPMANLQGRRLSLTFTPGSANVKAQLRLDDTILSETAGAVGAEVKLTIAINHPHSNSLGTTLHDQTIEKSYQRGASYALTYSFNPTVELLRARQDVLDIYRRTGLYSDSSREVVTETLNIVGLTWLHQTELMVRALGAKTNCDPLYHHRLGRVGQENGYYIDVDMQWDGLFSLDGNSTLQTQAGDAQNYFFSAMEHGVLEQMQGAGNPAVSTMKVLRLANQLPADLGKIFYATQGTWAGIQSQLVPGTYTAADLAEINKAVNPTSGTGAALVPQKGNIALNRWTGAGYVTRVATSASTTTRMGISGILNGGFNSLLGPISPLAVTKFANSNPIGSNDIAIILDRILTEEPIDLASGNYFLRTTDLAAGGAPPRGLSFSREYHSGRRAVNPVGLGYGWTHNWNVRAIRRSAYEPALGLGGTPYDVASAWWPPMPHSTSPRLLRMPCIGP